MTMTAKQCKEALRVLLAAYPRIELDEDSVIAYASVLAGYELEVVRDGIEALIKTSTHFPAVAELVASLRPRQRRWDADHAPREIEPPHGYYADVGRAGLDKMRRAKAAADSVRVNRERERMACEAEGKATQEATS